MTYSWKTLGAVAAGAGFAGWCAVRLLGPEAPDGARTERAPVAAVAERFRREELPGQLARWLAPDAAGTGAIRAAYEALPIASGSVEAVLLIALDKHLPRPTIFCTRPS